MIDTTQLFSWKQHNLWVLGLLILNLIDYQTTLLILNAGGIEANPLMNAIIQSTGTLWPILAIKVGFIGVMWWGFHLAEGIVTPYVTNLFLLAITLYALVVMRSVYACQYLGLF